MRNLIIYSATSLDLFIARENGEVDWLFEDGDYGYHNFFASIDTVLIGRKTYEQVLGFCKNDDDYPYKGKSNYVFSRQQNGSDQHAQFINEDAVGFIKNLKQQEGKDIWMVGGGQLNTLALDNDLIDQMMLFVHPIVLGSGIPMFTQISIEKHFKLDSTKTFPNGIVQLNYTRS